MLTLLLELDGMKANLEKNKTLEVLNQPQIQTPNDFPRFKPGHVTSKVNKPLLFSITLPDF
jgi:hypothetical protein